MEERKKVLHYFTNSRSHVVKSSFWPKTQTIFTSWYHQHFNHLPGLVWIIFVQSQRNINAPPSWLLSFRNVRRSFSYDHQKLQNIDMYGKYKTSHNFLHEEVNCKVDFGRNMHDYISIFITVILPWLWEWREKKRKFFPKHLLGILWRLMSSVNVPAALQTTWPDRN